MVLVPVVVTLGVLVLALVLGLVLARGGRAGSAGGASATIALIVALLVIAAVVVGAFVGLRRRGPARGRALRALRTGGAQASDPGVTMMASTGSVVMMSRRRYAGRQREGANGEDADDEGDEALHRFSFPAGLAPATEVIWWTVVCGRVRIALLPDAPARQISRAE